MAEKENETVQQMVEKYLTLKSEHEELTQKAQGAREALLVAVESDELEEIRTAKETRDNLTLKGEAKEMRLAELEVTIREQVPAEAQTRLDQINGELTELMGERKTLQKEFLSLAGRAASIQEFMKGPQFVPLRDGDQPTLPCLRFDLSRLDGEELGIYRQAVEKGREERDGLGSIPSREGALRREEHRLKKILDNPSKEVDRLLQIAEPQRTESVESQDEGLRALN
ncbi:MAG: hypothetical protein SWQ30_07815 [Thermodesulfobacteriota bacterium]|nr:hypothetical protein [Thermodesulfobacteriota bacterium]